MNYCHKMSEQAARARYDDIAKQIEREDGLVNTRTTWLLITETLLFGGVGVLAAKAAEVKPWERPYIVFMLLFAGVLLLAIGAQVASKCHSATHAVLDQLRYPQGTWQREPVLRRHYVRPFGGLLQHAQGIQFPIQLATLFLVCSAIGIAVLTALAVGVVWTWGTCAAP